MNKVGAILDAIDALNDVERDLLFGALQDDITLRIDRLGWMIVRQHDAEVEPDYWCPLNASKRCLSGVV